MAFYIQRPLTDDLRTRLKAQPKTYSSPFSASWSSTLGLLKSECDHLRKRGTDIVMMIDIEESDLRIDGELRANARPMSPNIAVAIETIKGPLIFPCARFHNWQDNVRAVALGMEALRKVDRYGISPNAEQYRGWQALPPGMAMPAAMTVEEAAAFIARSAWPNENDDHQACWAHRIVDEADFRDDQFRRAAKQLHPDVGGDPALFRKLTEARNLLNAQ